MKRVSGFSGKASVFIVILLVFFGGFVHFLYSSK